MFGNKGGFNNLMKQAKQMQDSMNIVQEEMAQIEITGESGAGLIKIVINGEYSCRRVEIDDSLLIENDKEMLEDLIAAAINDASRRVANAKKEKMAKVTGGLPLPPGFKMPF